MEAECVWPKMSLVRRLVWLKGAWAETRGQEYAKSMV